LKVENMLTLTQIQKMAMDRKAKIGIGDGGGDIVEKSAELARKEGYAEVEVFNEAQSLVSALKKGNIQGAVRGTLDAREVVNSLKSEFDVKKILRIAFLVMKDERLVLLAPVGIDEGRGIEEKLELISKGHELLTKFNVEPKIGILSGGRLEDMGRDLKVDESLLIGEELTKQTMDMGIKAKHFGILLENAFKESNMVISPEGITGNLIFRALHFFGGAIGIGASVVNLDNVFVDTSRAKKDYSTSIALASALCGL
jgi:putative methanogen marker protein 4